METFVFKNLNNEKQFALIVTMSKRSSLELLNDELGQNAEYVKSFRITGDDSVNVRSQYYWEFHEYFEKRYSKNTITLQEDPYFAKWYENENANELIEKIQYIYNEFLNMKHPEKEEIKNVTVTQTALF